ATAEGFSAEEAFAMEHAGTAPRVLVENLTVTAGSGRPAWLMRPVGGIDRTGHPLFDAVRRAGAERDAVVVVDLSHVDAVSPAGVGELLVCAHALRRTGGRLLFAGAGADVEPLLRIAAGRDAVPVFATAEEAVRAVTDDTDDDGPTAEASAGAATGARTAAATGPGTGAATGPGTGAATGPGTGAATGPGTAAVIGTGAGDGTGAGRTDGRRAPRSARDDQLARLRGAVSAQAVLEQAVGVVVALTGLCAGDALDVVREIARHTDIKTRHVAELIVEYARTGHLASDIRQQLRTSTADRVAVPSEAG
ncbi:STAS domain-containing protein, partial [Streptomyces sp. NPDC059786]|uniref:STAS domain-containing protein n=1 Tax=Streptomyces sp. NPDC059786 TaxID=3346946 RepID=UPI00364CBE75